MRPGLLLLSMVLVTACPPGPTCPLGSTRSVDAVAFAVEGKVKRLTMTFPAPTRCALPEGTFQASGTWTDEGTAPVELTIDRLDHIEAQGSATVNVRFTPKVTGLGELKVLVDPQLGIAQVPVFVARDGTSLPFIDERPGCSDAQRSTSGFVVCPDPTRDAGTLVKLDGGLVVRLDDSFAQVVGDVLWAERPDDGGVRLKRYVFDGGLVETHQGLTRPAALAQRFADERSTFRRGVAALVAEDGGLNIVTTVSRGTVDAVVIDPDLLWSWVDRWCSADGGCLPGTTGRSKVAGLEREVWWESSTADLIVHPRPIADAGSLFAVPLVAAQRLSLAGRSIQGTRRPTWDSPGEGQFVFDWHDGRVRLTHFPDDWPRGEENDEFLSFVLDDGVVRFVRP